MSKDFLEKYAVAIAVIAAGALVAGAVLFVGWDGNKNPANSDTEQLGLGDNTGDQQELFKNVKPVTEDDHIYGNKDARVKIVEFSDMECPFCIRFESTMKQVMASYGDKVAWVYRQYPLESLHQFAVPAAEASECVAAKAGNKKFWEFKDKFTVEIQNSDSVDVVKMAKDIGVDIADCYKNKQYASDVSADIDDANNAGFQGTPYSIVIVDGTPVTTIEGAYPFEEVQKILDQYLK